MSLLKEYLFTDRESMFTAVANRCAMHLSRGIEKQGSASIVVPGGTTPAPVFEKLSQMSLLWHNVSVIPSDERWVDIEHLQSNHRLIKNNLITNNAVSANLLSLKNSAETPQLGEQTSRATIKQCKRPFNVTLLGMGGDGHFASLFPNSNPIEVALDPAQAESCFAIDATGCPVAAEFTLRMSLSLSALLNSQVIIVMITGQAKLDLVRTALLENKPLQKPIAALLNQNSTAVEIYWAD